MNFEFSEQERLTFSAVRSAAQASGLAGPVLEPREQSEVSALFRGLLKGLAVAGYLDLGLLSDPAENQVFLMGCMQELARTCPEMYLSVEMSVRSLTDLIAIHGTREQKERLLPQLFSGKGVGAVAVVEDNMNVRDNPMATQGKKQNQGYRLTGTKDLVINASMADWIGVIGWLEEQAAVFLVKPGNQGVEVSRHTEGSQAHAAQWCSLSLSDVLVGEEDILGPLAWDTLIRGLAARENFILTAYALGLSKSAFEQAKSFAKTHQSGGKPILAYQEVGFKLSEMKTLLQAAELLAYKSAWSLARQEKDSEVLQHCAKVFCTEAAQEVASQALQILSRQGVTGSSSAETAYRRVKYCQIAGTSLELARVGIGDAVLKSKQ